MAARTLIASSTASNRLTTPAAPQGHIGAPKANAGESMTPEHREELRAQIKAQPDLAIDLLQQLGEIADEASQLGALVRSHELTIATQAEVIKVLSTAAAATLRECVGQPLWAGERYSIVQPSWKALSELANAVAMTLPSPKKF